MSNLSARLLIASGQPELSKQNQKSVKISMLPKPFLSLAIRMPTA
jgi:hypothetical protein